MVWKQEEPKLDLSSAAGTMTWNISSVLSDDACALCQFGSSHSHTPTKAARGISVDRKVCCLRFSLEPCANRALGVFKSEPYDHFCTWLKIVATQLFPSHSIMEVDMEMCGVPLPRQSQKQPCWLGWACHKGREVSWHCHLRHSCRIQNVCHMTRLPGNAFLCEGYECSTGWAEPCELQHARFWPSTLSRDDMGKGYSQLEYFLKNCV